MFYNIKPKIKEGFFVKEFAFLPYSKRAES